MDVPEPLAEQLSDLDRIVPRHRGMRGVQHQVMHPLERLQVLVRVERDVPACDAHREHVLDRDRDAGALLDAREVVDEPATERALPSIRRVHHHHRDAGVRGRLDRPVDLLDRVRSQTFRVSNKQGACSAPTASPKSSARARMRAGSWLSGSFVTITSTPR